MTREGLWPESGGEVRAAGGVSKAAHDQGAVILDVSSGRLFSLNPTAAGIWDRLVAGQPTAEIGAEVAREWNVPVSDVDRDLKHFLHQITQERLVLKAGR